MALSDTPYIVNPRTGERHYCGKLDPVPMFAGLPKFSSVVPKMPRSEWKPVDNRKRWPWIMNQLSFSSCTKNALIQCITRIRHAQGQTYASLGPGYGYSLVNGGRDAGAVISDAVKASQKYGECPFDIVGQSPIYRQQMPANAAKEALRFQLGECYALEDTDDIGTAIQLGWSVIGGIMVGDAWMRLDSEGVAGWTRGNGNHALCFDGMKQTRSGMWVFDSPGSWGAGYGDKGRAFAPEKCFETVYMDFWATRTVAWDPQDNPIPRAS